MNYYVSDQFTSWYMVGHYGVPTTLYGFTVLYEKESRLTFHIHNPITLLVPYTAVGCRAVGAVWGVAGGLHAILTSIS